MGADTNCLVILHYRYSGSAPNSADCTAIASHLVGAYGTSIQAGLPSTTVFTSVRVLDIGSSSGTEGTVTTNLAGTEAGAGGAASTCFLMQYKVARRYRGGHPRSYFPGGVTANMVNPQTWAPAYVTSQGAAWGTWVNSLLGFSSGSTTISTQVIVSYYSQGVLRPSPVIDPVVSNAARAGIATQRRRLAVP